MDPQPDYVVSLAQVNGSHEPLVGAGTADLRHGLLHEFRKHRAQGSRGGLHSTLFG